MGKTEREASLVRRDTECSLEHANCEMCIKYPGEGTDSEEATRSEVRAQRKGLGQKKKFGSHWYVDSIKSSQSGWDHLRGGQTEKRGGPFGILTFKSSRRYGKLAKGATEEEQDTWRQVQKVFQVEGSNHLCQRPLTDQPG